MMQNLRQQTLNRGSKKKLRRAILASMSGPQGSVIRVTHLEVMQKMDIFHAMTPVRNDRGHKKRGIV
ncbi:hypothetical protein ABHF91_13330 [Pseudaeromonas sp. ZJS20]|uniref:hypothetical protein n=1 Tax=Pseudaeromonas aegiceratis TaxID=3153928 RepID=UPI00390CC2CC